MLESKEDMRRRGALSPDQGDAVALTFARPVAPSNVHRKLVYPPSGLGWGRASAARTSVLRGK